MYKLFFVPSLNQMKGYSNQIDKIDFVSIIKKYEVDNGKTFLDKEKYFEAYAFCTTEESSALFAAVLENDNDLKNIDFKTINIGNIQDTEEVVYPKLLDNIKANITKEDKVFIAITGGPTFQNSEFIVASELSKAGYGIEIIGVDTVNTTTNDGKTNKFAISIEKDSEILIDDAKNIRIKHEVWFDRYNKETQIKNSILSFDYAHAKSLLNGILNKENENDIFNRLDELTNIFAGKYENSAIAQYIRATSLYEMGNYSEGILAACECLKLLFKCELKELPDSIDSKLFKCLYDNKENLSSILNNINISYKKIYEKLSQVEKNNYSNSGNYKDVSSNEACGKNYIGNVIGNNKLNEITNETIRHELSNKIEENNIEFLRNSFSLENDPLNNNYYISVLQEDLKVLYGDLISIIKNPNKLLDDRNKIQHAENINQDTLKEVLKEFIDRISFIKSNSGNNTINQKLINDIFRYDLKPKKEGNKNVIISIFGYSDPYSNKGLPTAPYFMCKELKNIDEIWYVITKEAKNAILDKKKIIEKALTNTFACSISIKFLSTEDFKLYDSIENLNDIISSNENNSYDYNTMFKKFKAFFEEKNKNKDYNYKFYFNNSSGLPLLRTIIMQSLLLDENNLLEIYSLPDGNKKGSKNKKDTISDDNPEKIASKSYSEDSPKNTDLKYVYKKLDLYEFEFINVFKLVRQMIDDKEYSRASQIFKYYSGGENLKKLGELLNNESLENNIISKIFINSEALTYTGDDESLKYYKKLRACLDLQAILNYLVRYIYRIENPDKQLEFGTELPEDLSEFSRFYSFIKNNANASYNNKLYYLRNPGEIYYLYQYFHYPFEEYRDKWKKLYEAISIRNDVIHPNDSSNLAAENFDFKTLYKFLAKLYSDVYNKAHNNTYNDFIGSVDAVLRKIKDKYSYSPLDEASNGNDSSAEKINNNLLTK